MSLRFPGDGGAESFWDTLVEGRSLIAEMSDERWAQLDAECRRELEGQKRPRGMFLDGLDCFDHQLLGMSRAAAIFADPRQRLLLEACYAALEDAGVRPSELSGRRVGVFIAEDGWYSGAYANQIPAEHRAAEEFITPGNNPCFLASRIATFFNLLGPALVFNTTCSGTYVALHQACEALQSGECEYALVGGVTLFLRLSQADLQHPEEVFSFRSDAAGYASSDGCGVLLLARTSGPGSERHSSHAIVRATGYNSGGKTASYARPSHEQQVRLVRELLRRADLSPRDVFYAEAHGTASLVGDSIEANALIEALGGDERDRPCWLSSVKGNIGHCHAASGMYALLKAVLSLRFGVIAPIRGLANHPLNPDITAQRSGIEFATEPVPFAAEFGPRRALLTGYGVNNMNAAVILEEPATPPANRVKSAEAGDRTSYVVCLSALSRERLLAVARRLQAYVRSTNAHEVDLRALAYTLQCGREPLPHRWAEEVSSLGELEAALTRFVDGAPEGGGYVGLVNGKAAASRSCGGDLGSTAQAWVSGAEVDWLSCYGEPRPVALRLPTYPFARHRFWVPKPTVESQSRNDQPRSETGRLPSEPARSTAWSEQILATLREVLLIEEGTGPDVEATFVELGLDSTSVVRFMQRLSALAGKQLAETLVFDHPTPSALARHLNGEGEAKQLRGAGDAVTRPEPLIARLMAVKDEFPELVPLQVEGDGPILFCVHPMSGDAGIYSKIAAAARGRLRVVGLRARGFLSEHHPLTSVEAMAEHHARALSRLRLGTSFHLLGASMGGAVAYETARCLRERGCEVGSIVLLEAPLVRDEAAAEPWRSDPVENLIMNANFLLIGMLHLDPEFRERKQAGEVVWRELEIRREHLPAELDERELPERLIELVRARGARQIAAILEGRLRSMAAVHANNLRALRQYRARPLLGSALPRMVLVRSESAKATSNGVYNPDYLLRVERKHGSLAPYLEPWDEIVPSLEHVVVRAANHFELLSGESATQTLLECLTNIARSANGELAPSRPEPIAVVGMSGLFPGAADVEAFCELLERGGSGLVTVPNRPGFDLGSKGPKHGGFLKDIAGFDAAFFRISPREAELMEPAERLFLQETWRALEDAGADPESLSRRSWGVFCGGGGDYGLQLREVLGYSPHVTLSGLPGRVSHVFGLTGPSQFVDAGCASSALAVVQACEQLTLGTCEAAIAGGAWTFATSNLLQAAEQTGLLTRSAHGKALDENADGMVPAEAVAVLVLKPLNRAIENGDRIYGVIEAWGTNHNGHSNGMASPNARAQIDLIRDTYRRFGVEPRSIGLVEANATGTRLGDLIEASALQAVFAETGHRVALGSVENNVGHAFQASGIVHLVKLLLALERRKLFATPHVETVNSALAAADSPFFVVQRSEPWEMPGGRLRGATNSFGATGTNVHLVLGEAPTVPARASTVARSSYVICISAATESALERRCFELKQWLEKHEHSSLSRLSANLLRRARLARRVAWVVRERGELIERLTTFRARDSAGTEYVEGVASASSQSTDDEVMTSLARSFLAGKIPDPSAVFAADDCLPESLPGYPFELRPHWIALAAPQSMQPSRRPLVPTSVATRDPNELRTLVCELVEQIAGYPAATIDTGRSFAELGLDSLMTTRLMSSINERFGSDIQLSDALAAPSIDAVVSLLVTCSPSAALVQPSDVAGQFEASTEAEWVTQRLGRLPSSLHVARLAMPEPRTGDLPPRGSPSALEALATEGVALARLTSRVCCLVAHRSVDLTRAVDGIDAAEIARLVELEPGMLLAPTSQEQERNLHHSERMGSPAWNVQHIYELERSDIDVSLLDRALERLAARQDVLRTRFVDAGRRWLQVVSPSCALRWQELNVTSLEQFEDFVSDRRERRIEVRTAPPFELWFARCEAKVRVAFIAHHCVADAFTPSLFIEALLSCYDELERSDPGADVFILEQYWQYALTQADVAAYRRPETLEYWTSALSAADARQALPFARDPATLEESDWLRAAGAALPLSLEFSARITELAKRLDVTHTQLFTAAIAVLFGVGLGNRRVTLRFVNSQRDRAGLFPALGEFSNIAFLGLTVGQDQSVRQLLDTVKEASLNALRFSKVLLDDLMALAGLEGLDGYYRDSTEIMLDSADLDSGGQPSRVMAARSLFVEGLERQLARRTSGFALASLFFQVLKVSGRISLAISYRSALYDRETAEAMLQIVVALLENMLDAPSTSASGLTQNLTLRLSALRARASAYSLPVVSKRTVSRERLALESPRPSTSPAGLRKRFPELVRLNSTRARNPVFWMHAGLGGIEAYLGLAAAIERPFFGIQARGWLTDRAPLQGIQAMAAYYVHVIQSEQPEGPYELGGYSLGGMLAYEVARQLQELGEEIRSLVLLDTLDTAALSGLRLSSKSEMLQAANLMLAATVVQHPERLTSTLVHRDELDAGQGDAEYLAQLVRLAGPRGLRSNEDQLSQTVQQLVKIQRHYDVERFVLLPLRDARTIRTLYFRNRSGRFFGELTPYFTARDGEILFDHSEYWLGWQRLLPALSIVDVPSSNHMVLLSEVESRTRIVESCRTFYAASNSSRPSREGDAEPTRSRALAPPTSGQAKMHEEMS